jgi:hypothetical protein
MLYKKRILKCGTWSYHFVVEIYQVNITILYIIHCRKLILWTC